jgi:hypothetical protein
VLPTFGIHSTEMGEAFPILGIPQLTLIIAFPILGCIKPKYFQCFPLLGKTQLERWGPYRIRERHKKEDGLYILEGKTGL